MELTISRTKREYRALFECCMRRSAMVARKEYGVRQSELCNAVFRGKWERCLTLYANRHNSYYEQAVQRELSDIAMQAFYDKINARTAIKNNLSETELLRNKVVALTDKLRLVEAQRDKVLARIHDGRCLWLWPESPCEMVLFESCPSAITSNGKVGRMETKMPMFGLHADSCRPAILRYVVEVWDDAMNCYKLL